MPELALPKSLAANPNLSQWLGFEHGGRVRLSPGKVEIGQGIATALAQIASETLEVCISRIEMVPADTAISPNEEVTSGSLSIQDSGLAIRHVAAEIRQLMLEAAARKWAVSPDQLAVEDGVVSGAHKKCISYWELATEVSLNRKATAGIFDLKARQRPKGATRIDRLDIPGRVFGTRPYIQDLALPMMRHGRVLRPERPGATLLSCDGSAFLKACPDVQLFRNGSFLGVVAASERLAEKAVRKLASLVAWGQGDAFPDRKTLADWLRAQPHSTSVVAETGQPFGLDQKRFERSYSRPFLAHASIGPSTAIASWQGDTLEVMSHTQGVFNLQKDLALVFSLPLHSVRVIHAEGAGCYGHNGADDVALDAALLARAAGCPVRVQWSRADELSQAPFGAAMQIDLAATLDAKGSIQHWEHTLYSNGHVARPGRNPTPVLLAAFALDPPAPRFVAGDPPLASGGGAQRNAVPLYAFPNLLVKQKRVLSTPLRTSSLRSLGAYGNVFAIESFMDELAVQAGCDPVEFRLRHLRDKRGRAVLEQVASMAGWGDAIVAEGCGCGIAFARYKNTGGYCGVVAEVDVNRDPRVTKLWITADLGEVINRDGAINQIEGGAIQSISWTLKEEVQFSGDQLNCASWADYPILRFSEVPAVDVCLIERPDEPPLGAGECAQGPTAAAIANAVYKALGVRVRQTPITRDRILSTLESS